MHINWANAIFEVVGIGMLVWLCAKIYLAEKAIEKHVKFISKAKSLQKKKKRDANQKKSS